MSDTKLVGAVGIKIRPVAKGFRRETERKVKEAAKNIQADIDLNPELAEEAKRRVKASAKRLVKEAEAEAGDIEIDVKANRKNLDKAVKELKDKSKIEFSYSPNRAGVERALRELDALIAKHGDIKIPVGTDKKSLKDFRDNLERSLKNQPLEISMHKDEKGWDALLADLKARKRDLEHATKFTVEPDELKSAAGMQRAIDRARRMAKEANAHIDIEYTNDLNSIDRALTELRSRLHHFDEKIVIEGDLDKHEIEAKIKELEERRLKQTMHLEYDPNEAGLRAAKARIEAELGRRHRIEVDLNIDEATLLGELAKIEAQLKAFERQPVKPKIKPEVSEPHKAKAQAELALLSRDRIMNVIVRVRDMTAFSFAKLTGLRAAARWTEEFGRALGSLDRNLPIVAGITLGVTQLSSAVLALVSNIFVLGASLAKIAFLGLLGPALLGGLVSVATVLTGVFKDFGAAVNGDERALNRLAPAGQAAARAIGSIFAEMRESISKNFWDQASEGMLRFANVALPAFKTGFEALSSSMGRGFGLILDSFNRFAEQGGLTAQFHLLAAGFELANKGTQNFWEALQTLGLVGSRVFPRLGLAFTEMSERFNNWVQRIAADGTMSRWIDDGISNLKSLWSVLVETGRVWGNFAQAAEAAGGLTLFKLAAGMKALDEATSKVRFQRNMQTIFEGAHEGMRLLWDALAQLGTAFDTFSRTIKNTLIGAGMAVSSAFRMIGDILGSPSVDTGLGSFLSGINEMFKGLRPAAEPIAQIIGTLGQLLGNIATDAGPLFRDLFTQLSSVFQTVYGVLKPFLPIFMELGQEVINILGPALQDLATEAGPALLQTLLDLKPAVLDLAKSISNWLTAAARELPLVFKMIDLVVMPIILGIAKGVELVTSVLKNMALLLSPFIKIAIDGLNTFRPILNAILMLHGLPALPELVPPDLGKNLQEIGNAAQPITSLAQALGKTGPAAEEAAAKELQAKRAADELRDASADASTKVNAMRRALEQLFGKPQAIEEAKAAYKQGFDDLVASAGALRPQLEGLGDALYQDGGLLNIASGNKAVLALKDNLESSANSIWSTAKAVYDTTKAQTGSVEQAYAAAKQVVDNSHVDFNRIAEEAGVDVAKVQGYWNQIFGKEWFLRASFVGTTDKFVAAKDEAERLGLEFDGEQFEAWLMANPDPAKVTTDQARKYIDDWAQSKWQANLTALPDEAQQTIRQLTGMTQEEWNRGDFTAVMKAAQFIPGLAEVLGQILNVKNRDYTAVIKAIADLMSAESTISAFLAVRRVATIEVRAAMPDLNGPDVSGNGRFGTIARGGILDGLGRGRHGFSPLYQAFANGGISMEQHVAQIARPGVMPRVWAERETGGEAYIPYALSKRNRSTSILSRVASDFGFQLVKKFADGGVPTPQAGPSYNAPVHIGQLITTDPDAAVSALKRKQRDAQAVANIKPF